MTRTQNLSRRAEMAFYASAFAAGFGIAADSLGLRSVAEQLIREP